ncbi:MAG: hypothetical protein ACPGID_14185 [Rubricella sp.]
MRALAFIGAAALVLAACGPDDGDAPGANLVVPGEGCQLTAQFCSQLYRNQDDLTLLYGDNPEQRITGDGGRAFIDRVLTEMQNARTVCEPLEGPRANTLNLPGPQGGVLALYTAEPLSSSAPCAFEYEPLRG